MADGRRCAFEKVDRYIYIWQEPGGRHEAAGILQKHLTMLGWSSSFNRATSRMMWLGTPSSSLSILSFFNVMISPVTLCRACTSAKSPSSVS